MIEVLLWILTIASGLFLGLAVVTLLKAWTAKMVTGKWPHEDAKSRNIFNLLP